MEKESAFDMPHLILQSDPVNGFMNTRKLYLNLVRITTKSDFVREISERFSVVLGM